MINKEKTLHYDIAVVHFYAEECWPAFRRQGRSPPPPPSHYAPTQNTENFLTPCILLHCSVHTACCPVHIVLFLSLQHCTACCYFSLQFTLSTHEYWHKSSSDTDPQTWTHVPPSVSSHCMVNKIPFNLGKLQNERQTVKFSLQHAMKARCVCVCVCVCVCSCAILT
jgi:hypothetical protein